MCCFKVLLLFQVITVFRSEDWRHKRQELAFGGCQWKYTHLLAGVFLEVNATEVCAQLRGLK